MSNEKFGAAIIGYGGMGSWHARQLKTMEELTLCGVYDILTERNEAAERAVFTPMPPGKSFSMTRRYR